MITELKRIKNRMVFRRIGNYYGNLFDSDHFMGRSAFQDSWIAPKNKYELKQGQNQKTTKGKVLK